MRVGRGVIYLVQGNETCRGLREESQTAVETIVLGLPGGTRVLRLIL